MDLKRTGWQVITHYYDEKPVLNEVLPLDDLKEHWSLDECWCQPQKLYEDCTCGDECYPVISHNSADRRELSEPDHSEDPAYGD